jgi:hypothetical protein
VGNEVVRSTNALCRLPIAVCTVLLIAGCASSPKADLQAEREAVGRAIERMRVLISAAPTAAAKNEVTSIRRDLSSQPRAIVVSSLLKALRDGQDEFNSVLIHMLDDLDANDWVAVKFRARTMTIESALKLVAAGAARAEQADAFIGRIRESCSTDLQALIATWTLLLESTPITARRVTQQIDVTANVQGLATLGIIRVAGTINLAPALAGIKQKRITAPPVIMAQALIHLSGRRLKANLAAWLASPPKAQEAALIAVDLLRLIPAKLGPADPKRVADAKEWTKALSSTATWSGVIHAQLKALAAAQPKPNAATDASAAARLKRASILVGVLDDGDAITWLSKLPAPSCIVALQRLAGIDTLVRPPATARP